MGSWQNMASGTREESQDLLLLQETEVCLVDNSEAGPHERETSMDGSELDF